MKTHLGERGLKGGYGESKDIPRNKPPRFTLLTSLWSDPQEMPDSKGVSTVWREK